MKQTTRYGQASERTQSAGRERVAEARARRESGRKRATSPLSSPRQLRLLGVLAAPWNRLRRRSPGHVERGARGARAPDSPRAGGVGNGLAAYAAVAAAVAAAATAANIACCRSEKAAAASASSGNCNPLLLPLALLLLLLLLFSFSFSFSLFRFRSPSCPIEKLPRH